MARKTLLGIAEVAELAGVSRAAVTNWRTRYAEFPAPVSDLRSGPIFDAAEIREWLRVYRGDDAELPELDQWVQRNRALVELVFASWMEKEVWPAADDLQRILDRRGSPIDVHQAYNEIPRLPGEQWSLYPSAVSLPLRILAQLPEAQPIALACLALVKRATEVYLSDVDPLVVTSEDRELLSQLPDSALVAKAGQLLMGDYPNPTGGGAYGGDSWQFQVHGPMARRFVDVNSLDDYFQRQAEILGESPRALVTERARKLRAFTVMPFGEEWSTGVYDMLQRAAEAIRDDFDIVMHRADEISRPGKITDQIVAALEEADFVIADITGANPNVMWELGYAQHADRPAVILNQDVSTSPFDLRDWRQVAYSRTPTSMEEHKVSECLRQVCIQTL